MSSYVSLIFLALVRSIPSPLAMGVYLLILSCAGRVAFGGALLRKCNNPLVTLSSCVCKVPWALRGGCEGNAVSAETSAAFRLTRCTESLQNRHVRSFYRNFSSAQKHRPQAGRKPDISPCLVRHGRGRGLRCGVYAGNAINAVNSCCHAAGLIRMRTSGGRPAPWRSGMICRR